VTDAQTMRARADRIAEEVLLPAATAVDQADRVPAEHLRLLADEGFYGVAAPVDEGGLGVEDMATAGYLLETLAGGCLATTLVWMQHHGAVLATAFSDKPSLRERWLSPLARGQRRAGLALAGLRPGRDALRVRIVDGGYALDGAVPWVSGWDMIDTILLGARDADDLIHFFLLDATVSTTLAAELLDLVAMRASRTVTLHFADHFVAGDRLLDTQPFAEWASGEAAGSALNGFLALGVTSRCCRLLGPTELDDELVAARGLLLAADAEKTPAARAVASELALRAAARLVVQTGSRAVLRGVAPERLLREAGALLVFGSRPLIRDALLDRLG